MSMHQGGEKMAIAPELSIIVPVFNEAANVGPLVELVATALEDDAWELIFVDDNSPDGTADRVKAIAATDPRVRCIRRVGRRGLSGASIEGMLSSSARYVAVMDGDLQHDERVLVRMLALIRAQGTDLVIATRERDGSSITGLSGQRSLVSDFGRFLSRLVIKADVKDPMSGFFMVRREVVEAAAPKLATEGFKILADLLATTDRPLVIRETPYVFRERQHGESKLDARVAFDYLGFLLHHLTGRLVPVRFFLFGLVGASGVVVHLGVLKTVLAMLPASGFDIAQTSATFVAMFSNFLLNNGLTYRDRRLVGWALVPGFLIFAASCSIGVIANVGLARIIFSEGQQWWVAGLAGALTGAVFNYVTSGLLVWRKKS
jgi:dolichol-phosphate mannosyltransferase